MRIPTAPTRPRRGCCRQTRRQERVGRPIARWQPFLSSILSPLKRWVRASRYRLPPAFVRHACLVLGFRLIRRSVSLCLCPSICCVDGSAVLARACTWRAGQAFMGGLGGMAHVTSAQHYGVWACVRGWDAREQRRCGEALSWLAPVPFSLHLLLLGVLCLCRACPSCGAARTQGTRPAGLDVPWCPSSRPLARLSFPSVCALRSGWLVLKMLKQTGQRGI